YTLLVTNSAGAATSAAATLTVPTSPVMTTQPASQTVAAGASANFSVAATGTGPLRYQWRFNGTPQTGATNSNLNLNNVQPVNEGNYTVVVTNSAGSVTSAVAVLTVVVPPTITAQPQGRTNVTGTTVTFNGVATGSNPLS